MNQARLRDTGRFQNLSLRNASTIEPGTGTELLNVLDPKNRYPKPLRPIGGGSSATDCYTSSKGTSIETAGLDRILKIDHPGMTVTAQAGVPLDLLNRTLADEGLEPAPE